MRLLIIFISTIVVLSFHISCTSHKEENSDTSKELISYQTEHYDTYSSNFIEREDGSIDTTKFSIDYPVFTENWVNELIQKELFNQSKPQSLAKNFLAEYDEYYEGTEQMFTPPWEGMTKVEVTHQTPQYITLRLHNFEYTGGAHGNYYYQYLNIDVPNKKALHLKDIIDPSKEDEFKRLAEAAFREDEGLSQTDSLNEKYFFENGEFEITQNSGLEEEGLTLLYNIYEIKPYSEGVTILTLEYDKLDQILSEEAKNLIQY